MSNSFISVTLTLISISKQCNSPVTEQNKTSPLFNNKGATKIGSDNLCFHKSFPDNCSSARQSPSNVPNNTLFDGACKQPEALMLPLPNLDFQTSDPSCNVHFTLLLLFLIFSIIINIYLHR